jgi:hypothetical protein
MKTGGWIMAEECFLYCGVRMLKRYAYEHPTQPWNSGLVEAESYAAARRKVGSRCRIKLIWVSEEMVREVANNRDLADEVIASVFRVGRGYLIRRMLMDRSCPYCG